MCMNPSHEDECWRIKLLIHHLRFEYIKPIVFGCMNPTRVGGVSQLLHQWLPLALFKLDREHVYC